MKDPANNKEKKDIVIPDTDKSVKEDKSTRKFVTWMVVIIVLIIIVGGAVIYWQINLYITQSNKNKAQDLYISALKTKQQNLEKLKPNYEKITAKGSNGLSDADLILQAMPSDKGFDSLIAMIEKIGAESGVTVNSISQGKDKKGGSGISGVITYPVDVDLEGDYKGILEFLTKTEKSARVMNFASMKLSGDIGSNKNSAKVTMNVYYKLPADISTKEEELK